MTPSLQGKDELRMPMAPRDILQNALRRELWGPSNEVIGIPVNTAGGAVVLTKEQAESTAFHDATTHEEILDSDPCRRYGIGVLFPGATSKRAYPGDGTPAGEELAAASLTDPSDELVAPQNETNTRHVNSADDCDDLDLTDANGFRPSAMAISFLARATSGGRLDIAVDAARYKPLNVTKRRDKGSDLHLDWWLREPLRFTGQLDAGRLATPRPTLVTVELESVGVATLAGALPRVRAFSRALPDSNDSLLRLVTLALENPSQGAGSANTLFQCRMLATPAGGLRIEPYKQAESLLADAEQASMDLLYRNCRTFAIGHGCAATWETDDGQAATSVSTDAMPSYEVPSLTPDIYVTDDAGERKKVEVSMKELAVGSDVGRQQIQQVLAGYEQWIHIQEGSISSLPSQLQNAARRHMEACQDALARMKDGWRLATTHPLAMQAFSMANTAMLAQQVRSRADDRKVTLQDGQVEISGTRSDGKAAKGQGMWRPFQIAFVLASLPEIVDPSHRRRELVDLIFFPTGGGKTEAYLGAAAVSMLARRLKDPHDAGTEVIMRYTLRLLTSQQFQRAAALACALDDLREKNPEQLGNGPFSIGVWVGSSSTPNTHQDAKAKLRAMHRDKHASNPFLLTRCPWCAAKFGPVSTGRKVEMVAGYQEELARVTFRCPDPGCEFSRRPLPVYVVDQDIYEQRPTILIGTVDKFAMLAWKTDGHRIFGLGASGQREVSPPGLVIQDELHLISGPLGSMVALYEPMIDDLCADKRHDPPIAPKIIASTATIRGYQNQVATLFGRNRVALFPPHGLEEGHSFFAEPETAPDGTPTPGRRYLGLMAPSLGSMQSLQVRVISAALMGATEIPEGSPSGRDGYWTNLMFMNSLRELGNTVSLLDSDVPDHLRGLRRRTGAESVRFPSHRLELTSRRSDDEISKATDQLKVAFGDARCLDVCLASNIIEVGIDIDRLGLMTIVGQPKTTAQYIQVSGRVGRKPQVSPGLVLTLYGAAKPRDRSHYERFKTYHQMLYAQVEPTSLTPFALPALERALHAAAVLHIRQSSPTTGVMPFPETAFETAVGLLRDRATACAWDEIGSLDQVASKRLHEGISWERTEWSANPPGTPVAGDPANGLMRTAGTGSRPNEHRLTWDVPMSMRNVDANCTLCIDDAYNNDDAMGAAK